MTLQGSELFFLSHTEDRAAQKSKGDCLAPQKVKYDYILLTFSQPLQMKKSRFCTRIGPFKQAIAFVILPYH